MLIKDVISEQEKNKCLRQNKSLEHMEQEKRG
jgi:hypothetical protein